MKNKLIIIVFVLLSLNLKSQTTVLGVVKDNITQEPVFNAEVSIDNGVAVYTGTDGKFVLKTDKTTGGTIIINVQVSNVSTISQNFERTVSNLSSENNFELFIENHKYSIMGTVTENSLGFNGKIYFFLYNKEIEIKDGRFQVFVPSGVINTSEGILHYKIQKSDKKIYQNTIEIKRDKTSYYEEINF